MFASTVKILVVILTAIPWLILFCYDNVVVFLRSKHFTFNFKVDAKDFHFRLSEQLTSGH